MLINPLTGRKIHRNSRTHLELIRKGHLENDIAPADEPESESDEPNSEYSDSDTEEGYTTEDESSSNRVKVEISKEDELNDNADKLRQLRRDPSVIDTLTNEQIDKIYEYVELLQKK